MTPLQLARGHLAKAQEFLAEAQSALANGHASAATSNAIVAGINAKDVICLVLVAKTDKADDHRRAVHELRKAGEMGAAVAETLDRLLKSKTKSQYQAAPMTHKDAGAAVKLAARLVAQAERAISRA